MSEKEVSKEFIERLREMFPRLVNGCSLVELDALEEMVRHERLQRLYKLFNDDPSKIPVGMSVYDAPEWLLKAEASGDGIVLDELDTPNNVVPMRRRGIKT